MSTEFERKTTFAQSAPQNVAHSAHAPGGANVAIRDGNFAPNAANQVVQPPQDVFEGQSNAQGERVRGILRYGVSRNVYRGEFENNVPHGEGEMEYYYGGKFKGTFLKGRRHEGCTVYPDGTEYTGQYNRSVGQNHEVPAIGFDFEQGEGAWKWGPRSKAHLNRGAVLFEGLSIGGQPTKGRETYAPDWAWVEYKGSFKNEAWDGDGVLITKFYDPAFDTVAVARNLIDSRESSHFKLEAWVRPEKLKGIVKLLGSHLRPIHQSSSLQQQQQPQQSQLQQQQQQQVHGRPQHSQSPQNSSLLPANSLTPYGTTGSPSLTLERLLVSAAPWGFPMTISGAFDQGGLKNGEIHSLDGTVYRGSCTDIRPTLTQAITSSPNSPAIQQQQTELAPPFHPETVSFVRQGKGELISNSQGKEVIFSGLNQKLSAGALDIAPDISQSKHDRSITSDEIAAVMTVYRKYVTGFPNLKKFTGEFRNNALFEGAADYNSGDTFTGQFIGGHHPRQGKYCVFSTKEVYEGMLDKGLVRVGRGKMKFPNNIIYEGVYATTAQSKPRGSEVKYEINESELVEAPDSDTPLKGIPLNGQLRFGYGHKWAGALYVGDVDERHVPHGVGKLQFKAGLPTGADATDQPIYLPSFDADRSGGRNALVLPTGEVFDFTSNRAIQVEDADMSKNVRTNSSELNDNPSLPDLNDRFDIWLEYEGQFDHGRRKNGVMLYMDQQRYAGGFDVNHRKHGSGQWSHATQWRNDPRGVDISFKGDYEHGRRVYGTVTKSTGEIYSGFFDNRSQLYSGPGKLTLPRHKLVFQGAFMDGVALNGEITYNEPVTSAAAIQQGAIGGYPLAMHAAIRYSGPVDDSFMPHGRGEMFYSVEHQQKTLVSSMQTRFTRRYLGSWFHGERHGGGKLTFNTGGVLEGLFVKGDCPFGKLKLNTGDIYVGDLDSEFNFHGRGVLLFNWRNVALKPGSKVETKQEDKSKRVFNSGRIEEPKMVAVDLSTIPSTAPLATNRVAFEGVFARGRCARGITTYRCGAQLHGEFFDFATGDVLPFGMNPPLPGEDRPPVTLPPMKKPVRVEMKVKDLSKLKHSTSDSDSDSDSDVELSAPPSIEAPTPAASPIRELLGDQPEVPAATQTTAIAIKALSDAWIRRDFARRMLFFIAKQKRESAAAISASIYAKSAAATAAVAAIEKHYSTSSLSDQDSSKKYDNSSHINLARTNEPTIDDLPEDTPFLVLVKRLIEDFSLPDKNSLLPEDEVKEKRTGPQDIVQATNDDKVDNNADVGAVVNSGVNIHSNVDVEAKVSERKVLEEESDGQDPAASSLVENTEGEFSTNIWPLPMDDPRSAINCDLLEAGSGILDSEGFEPYLLILGDGTRYFHRPQAIREKLSVVATDYLKDLSKSWMECSTDPQSLPSLDEAEKQLVWIESGASAYFEGVRQLILDSLLSDTKKAESVLEKMKEQKYWPKMLPLQRPELPDEICHSLFNTQKEGLLSTFLSLTRNSRATSDQMLSSLALVFAFFTLDRQFDSKCRDRFNASYSCPNSEVSQQEYRETFESVLRQFTKTLVEDSKIRQQLSAVCGALFDQGTMGWAKVPASLQQVFFEFAEKIGLSVKEGKLGYSEKEEALPGFDKLPNLPHVDNTFAVLSRTVIQHEEDMLGLIRDSPLFRNAAAAYTEACNAYAEFDRWSLSLIEAIHMLDDTFVEKLLRRSARSKQHFAEFMSKQLTWLRRERMEPLSTCSKLLPEVAEKYCIEAEAYINFRNSVEGPYRDNLSTSIKNAITKLRTLADRAKEVDMQLGQTASENLKPLVEQSQSWYEKRTQQRNSLVRELRALELQTAIGRRDIGDVNRLLKERFTPSEVVLPTNQPRDSVHAVDIEFVDITWCNQRGIDSLRLSVQAAQVRILRMIIDQIRVKASIKLGLPSPTIISDRTIAAVSQGEQNPYHGDHARLRASTADVLSRVNEMQETYLFESLVEGKDDMHVECARLLVEAGARLDQPTDAQGRTVVHILCQIPLPKRVGIAISLGYRVPTEPLSREEKSSLHFAAQSGCFDSTFALLQNGSTRINFPNCEGDTPLHLARNPVLAMLLIENGARLKAKNLRGMKPLESSGLQSDTTLQGQARNADKAFQQRRIRAVPSLSILTESNPNWQRDELVHVCIGCSEKFTFFNRRHHCRLCGHIFCSTCSNHEVCTQDALAAASGELDKVRDKHRICDGCSNKIELVHATLPDSLRDIHIRPKLDSEEKRDEDVNDSNVKDEPFNGKSASGAGRNAKGIGKSASAFSLPPIEIPVNFASSKPEIAEEVSCEISDIVNSSQADPEIIEADE